MSTLSSSSSLQLRVKRLAPSARLPVKAHSGDAGYDLFAAYSGTVPARGQALIKTEIAIALPTGCMAQLAPRSSLALKNSIDLGGGIIDSPYRGPIGVILFNLGDVDFNYKAGDRIAQMIVQKVESPEVLEVDSLDDTDRGQGGFGSSGV